MFGLLWREGLGSARERRRALFCFIQEVMEREEKRRKEKERDRPLKSVLSTLFRVMFSKLCWIRNGEDTTGRDGTGAGGNLGITAPVLLIVAIPLLHLELPPCPHVAPPTLKGR